MGRWDIDKKSVERNKKIENQLLRFNIIMNNLIPNFVKKLDYKMQMKVQKYVKTVSPFYYVTYMICLLVTSFIITNIELPRPVVIVAVVIIIIIMMLLRASFSGKGHRKKKDNKVLV